MILLWGSEGYSKDAVSWNYNGPRLHNYTTLVSTEQYIMTFIVLGVIFLLFVFRKNTVIGIIWNFVSLAITTLLLTLFANYAKNELKAWWKKD
jgi:hypothetical protein